MFSHWMVGRLVVQPTSNGIGGASGCFERVAQKPTEITPDAVDNRSHRILRILRAPAPQQNRIYDMLQLQARL
ncbi:hypothetical protein CERSUDRAFT_86284 [Gelatoporia subvermispora B]|uniref:Uncharacterized protein n=1 Tax=Ceriporiopsis subvermispora (strain B) TaxID=914234 RepID=M2QRN2_CERS8|nr:hypothetical protein CERSUDRAFT_86284 [Gelatoporia subvermispora B]